MIMYDMTMKIMAARPDVSYVETVVSVHPDAPVWHLAFVANKNLVVGDYLGLKCSKYLVRCWICSLCLLLMGLIWR